MVQVADQIFPEGLGRPKVVPRVAATALLINEVPRERALCATSVSHM